MAVWTAALGLPSELKSSLSRHQVSLFVSRRRPRKSHPAFPVCLSIIIIIIILIIIIFLSFQGVVFFVKLMGLIGSGGKAVWSSDFRSLEA